MRKTTRAKLIEAALEVFGERGYHHATIQQIVRRAGTNVAAVNYHFGDKAQFYGEVVSHALTLDKDAEHMDLGDEPPEEQLRTFVFWFLHHVVGVHKPSSSLEKIHIQEMVNPSPILDTLVETFIRPNHMKLRAIVAALLPDDATEQDVRHHCFSVIGQCLHYKFARPVMDRLYADIEFTEDYVNVLAEHITNVSLAAMRAVPGQRLVAAQRGGARQT